MKFAIALFVFLFTTAHAQTPAPPEREKLRAGTEITVAKYLPQAKAFEIIINNEPAVGPNVATPEDLQKAIDMEGSPRDFLKRMLRDVGSIYVLKKDLPLLWEDEVVQREAGKKPRKAPKKN